MEFQHSIDMLEQWSEDWQMLFNSGMCLILHLGFNNSKLEYKMGGEVMETVEFEYRQFFFLAWKTSTNRF